MKVNKEIPLKLVFELGRTKKTVGEVLNITKGTVYTLEESKLDNVAIYIDKKKIGEGEILAQGGYMFVEIQKLFDENGEEIQ